LLQIFSIASGWCVAFSLLWIPHPPPPLNSTYSSFLQDGHGVSGVHILYEAYAENTQAEAADEDVLYPEIAALSPEDNNETIDNVFEHRGLAIANSGMTVRIYNSTFMDIHQYGFQATYNTGNLYMFNVSMKNIQAGVLNNIMAGNATIESCIFESIDSVSVIRAVRSRMVEIRDTKFVDSTGTVSSCGKFGLS
jgi:hypothetical protein